MELSELECVFYCEMVSAYAKRKILEEDKQIYIPFLGMVLTQDKDRKHFMGLYLGLHRDFEAVFP